MLQLLRPRLSFGGFQSNPALPRLLRRPRRRFLSTKSTPEGQPQDAQSRVDRVVFRLPRFLRRYVEPLRRAPVTHVSSFLLLHEITAVVPLLGLAAVFHYSHWMPPLISEGKWVSEGVEKFGRYFRRKGWLGEDGRKRDKLWGRGEGGVRIVTELATAYAVTKAILPLRLIFSVWATPWFARVFVVPCLGIVKRVFKRKAKAVPSAAAGTGALSGGVVGKAAGTQQGTSVSSAANNGGRKSA